MEKHSIDEQQQQQYSSPFSWWWDSHNRPPQSQWLNSALTELDDKIKMILDLIEDDGDTFAKRAEMYYQKKPQLIKMVQELHRSYRALADKYDQLKSESSIKASNNGSLSNAFRKSRPRPLQIKPQLNLSPIEAPNFNSESIEEFSSAGAGYSDRSGTSSVELQSPENFVAIDSNDNNKMMDNNNNYNNGGVMMMTREKMWSDEQMKFSKLLEENLSKQAELIRRNDEKREMINELRNEKRILSEKVISNGLLNQSNKGLTTKRNKSQARKLRGLFCLA